MINAWNSLALKLADRLGNDRTIIFCGSPQPVGHTQALVA